MNCDPMSVSSRCALNGTLAMRWRRIGTAALCVLESNISIIADAVDADKNIEFTLFHTHFHVIEIMTQSAVIDQPLMVADDNIP